jgi:seryl-tRNA synthetase
MADDIKSLAARVQKLETIVNGRGKTIEELERKGKYLEGTLDDVNKLKDRMAAAEKSVTDLRSKISHSSP